jgi:hypothetical protein
MVHIYPIDRPAETESYAEQQLYELFRGRLSDDFWVWHSVPWHSHNTDDEPRDGEADFYIVNPAYGILTLEVKGGKIRWDPNTRAWYTRNRDGEARLRTHPPDQARRSKYELKRKLEGSPITRMYAKQGRYRIAYGVWFPQTHWEPGEKMVGDKYFVLDERDLDDAEQALVRVMHHFALKEPLAPLTEAEMHAALDVIGDRLTPTPIGLFADRIEQISEEQFARIEALWRDRRVAVIFGPAGSGKTVVATELAMRLAATGEHVLYVLRNEYMAEGLSTMARQDPRFQQAPYDIFTLTDVVQRVASQGGLQADKVADIDQTTWRGQNELRSILVDNQRTLKAAGQPMPYTAVIVDDVEDIEQVLCIPLQNMLKQPHTGFYYSFGDETQRIDIDSPWEWRPANWRPPALQMTEIWRNTRPIHEQLTEYQPQLRSCRFRGPNGQPIQYIAPGTAPKGKPPAEPVDDALNAALDDIYAAVPGIREEEILVISGRAQTKSRWYHAEARALCGRRLQWLRKGEPRQGKVALTTIRSTKGMEYKAIVLAELDGLTPHDKKRDNRLYLAISRALRYLVVLGTEADIKPTGQAR